jgi:hypothetical protein
MGRYLVQPGLLLVRSEILLQTAMSSLLSREFRVEQSSGKPKWAREHASDAGKIAAVRDVHSRDVKMIEKILSADFIYVGDLTLLSLSSSKNCWTRYLG